MPASAISCFPHARMWLEALKLGLQGSVALTAASERYAALGFDWIGGARAYGAAWSRDWGPLLSPGSAEAVSGFVGLCEAIAADSTAAVERRWMEAMALLKQRRRGEIEFLKLFTQTPARQRFRTFPDTACTLLDLPSLRLIDISRPQRHRLANYTVVFAPRAGHHSNIAERVAAFLRGQGLSRMAIVEQKCAEQIPLYIDGRRHCEGFEGQIDQYRQVLEYLYNQTGVPAHLIAICQPGPLLMSTLILYPHLGRTFGSAGAPMHTQAQAGFLTDFARVAGPGYIDALLAFFGRRVPGGCAGRGRRVLDGRLQIAGFYLLSLDAHLRNFRRLLADLRKGRDAAAERQIAFYQWYNYAHHFPEGFIRDTFKKIFVHNELIRGKLQVAGRTIGVADYPSSVPIWALGGRRDEIAPPLQATGHMPLLQGLPERSRLTLVCDGGHMALFRSRRILQSHYTQVAGFLLRHSERASSAAAPPPPQI